MRFTPEKALTICHRKLPPQKYTGTCYDCYYHSMRCELGLENQSSECQRYVGDNYFTNIVRKNILDDPDWCKDNWHRLCQTDKELFITIHGEESLMLKAGKKVVCKEVKEITIKVCLPDSPRDEHLADSNQLAKTACKFLNEKQKQQRDNGHCWLYYYPVLHDVVE